MEVKINNKFFRRNNNKIKDNNFIFTNNPLIFMICFVFLIYPIHLSKQKIYNLRLLIRESEVIITIIGKNNQQLLSQDFYNLYTPSEILINGNRQNQISIYALNLQNDENEITLKWNVQFTTCYSMFDGQSNIIKIDLSKLDSSRVTTMCYMFYQCNSLTSINFNNFDTSLVKDFSYVFYGCSSLLSLDISNFNTPSINNMYLTFYDCNSLKSLDLSNFDTSHVTDMYGLFYNCYSLQSVNLNNFNTSLVTNMGAMFLYCYSLRSIDLSSFNTLNVKDMKGMFCYCTCLQSLDLSSFNTSLVTNMYSMFLDCNSITSINLSSFNTSLVTEMQSMFRNCYSLTSLDIRNFNTSSAIKMYTMFDNCRSLKYLDLQGFDTSNAVDMNRMFLNCSSLTTLNLSSFDTSKVSNMTNMFKGCYNNLLYCINDDNNGQNKLLSTLIDNSFLNNNCSQLCLLKNKKYIFVKEKCLINCYDDNIYKYEYENICYSSCPNGTKNSMNYEYICIKDYPTVIATTNIIYDVRDITIINGLDHSSYSYITDINYFINLCKINDNMTTKDDIINKIRDELDKGKLDQLIQNYIEQEKDDLLAEENNIIYQITSTYNQNNKEYNNISTINLGECESLLRFHNNISNDTTLLIFKVDIMEEGLLIPIIEYEVYNSETKQKLSLDICKDTKINISIPVFIDENDLFKYNISSDYYNDICFPYTSNEKTDIILDDRKKEFNQNNMSLCENNCEYQGYNFTSKRVACECLIKKIFPSLSEITLNKEQLVQKFFDFKKTMNICIIKCYKKVFCKEGIITNIGSYILLTIIISNIILAVAFKFKGYILLKNKINKIMTNLEQKKNKKNVKNNVINQNNILNSHQKLKQSNNLKNKIKTKRDSKKNILIKNENNNPPTKTKKYKNSRKNKISKSERYKNSLSNSKLRQSNILMDVEKNQNFNVSIYNTSNKRKNKTSDNQKYMKYNDYELNNLSYKDALKIDKRSYILYYISLLKTKHLIIFTFFTYTDYNSKIIKISLFLFSFALYYAVNALFFTDSTIHKIYEDKGSFNFIYQLPKLIYSTVISLAINTIVKYFSLSEKDILKIKEKNKNMNEEKTKLLKCLIIKFILFYIISIIFLILFWYYLSCFCAIYKNSKIHLIKGTIISFGLSLLYPLGINLLPGFFRLPSLKGSRECIYKISKIIQLI